MSRSLRLSLVLLFAGLFQAGCVREPSADIFEAIGRKDFREEEVRDFITADPTVVSDRDASGDTPLCLEASYGRVSLIAFLLDQGADVNETGYHGITPLAAACHSGKFEAAKLLLERGADPNIADNDGETPLHHIIMWCPEQFELFQLVVESGGATDVLTSDGRTLLEFCRDRRQDYAAPDYSGAPGLREKLLAAYDRLDAFLQQESAAGATNDKPADRED